MSASVVQVDPSMKEREDRKLEPYQERKEGKHRELEPYQKEVEHPKVCHVFKVGRFHENMYEMK